MYYMENDCYVRAASAYESVGYEKAWHNIMRRVNASSGAERMYWENVGVALNEIAGGN